MGKKGKTVTEVQDQILNQFEHTKRAYARHDRELSISEKLIAQIPQRKAEQLEREKKQAEKPYISHYQPNNILNRIKYMSPEDGKIALKAHLKELKNSQK